jgi:hypothetical protein
MTTFVAKARPRRGTQYWWITCGRPDLAAGGRCIGFIGRADPIGPEEVGKALREVDDPKGPIVTGEGEWFLMRPLRGHYFRRKGERAYQVSFTAPKVRIRNPALPDYFICPQCGRENLVDPATFGAPAPV